MKAYRKALLCVLACCVVISGCASRANTSVGSGMESASGSDKTKRVSPYLSITETVYLDEEQTQMESICVIYDFKRRKLIQKGRVPYTSGYPLTTYSSVQNCVFYSALSDRGDQLYQEKNGKTVQLTDQLCALNHIVQCGDKLFLAAKYLNHYCIEPNLFDLKSGKLEKIFPDTNDDRFTWAVTCDPEANHLYFSYYSDNLQRGNLEEYNKQNYTEETEVPDCAPSTICAVDVNTEKVTPIYWTDDYIWGIAINGSNLYYSGSKSSISPKEDHTCYMVDLRTKEKTNLDIPILISGDMAVWDNILYCIGWNNDVRGIYMIDLKTKNVQLLYKASEKGFINGFSLNYQT